MGKWYPGCQLGTSSVTLALALALALGAGAEATLSETVSSLSCLFQEPSAGTGEVLLSISYLPAANRLLVVLIKAKNLHSSQSKELLGKGE